MSRRPRKRRATFGWRASREESKRHHELADGPAVTERGDRLAGPLQRIGRADLWRDLVFAPPAEQPLNMIGVALRLAGDEPAPEHAAHIAALEQGQVEREFCDSSREADDEEAAFPGD